MDSELGEEEGVFIFAQLGLPRDVPINFMGFRVQIFSIVCHAVPHLVQLLESPGIVRIWWVWG